MLEFYQAYANYKEFDPLLTKGVLKVPWRGRGERTTEGRLQRS